MCWCPDTVTLQKGKAFFLERGSPMHRTRVLIGLTVLGITLADCAAASSTPSTPNPSASPSPWPSGDNGISSLPADQIAQLAAQALATAASVHLTGFVQDEGEQRIDGQS
jgi:hypothetical protein